MLLLPPLPPGGLGAGSTGVEVLVFLVLSNYATNSCCVQTRKPVLLEKFFLDPSPNPRKVESNYTTNSAACRQESCLTRVLSRPSPTQGEREMHTLPSEPLGALSTSPRPGLEPSSSRDCLRHTHRTPVSFLRPPSPSAPGLWRSSW